VPPGGRTRRVIQRLLHHPSAVLGLALLALVIGLVLLAPLIARYGPDDISIDALNQTPSRAHWFGTDYLGRDVWSRILYGGRLSLLAGVCVLAIEVVVGVVLGLVAGYVGRAVDGLVMRCMDVLLTLPGLLLALGIVAILGEGLPSVIIALGIGGVPAYARMARAMTLKVRQHEYVLAARAQGCGSLHILRRHILPNVADPLIVMATTSVGGAILTVSALSYLGVGTQPPQADWGTLLSHGYEHMFEAWSEMFFPGVAVSLTVLGINLLGDGLTDALNPRL
jgi:peptide/nickel transport system permease protein